MTEQKKQACEPSEAAVLFAAKEFSCAPFPSKASITKARRALIAAVAADPLLSTAGEMREWLVELRNELNEWSLDENGEDYNNPLLNALLARIGVQD